MMVYINLFVLTVYPDTVEPSELLCPGNNRVIYRLRQEENNCETKGPPLFQPESWSRVVSCDISCE